MFHGREIETEEYMSDGWMARVVMMKIK